MSIFSDDIRVSEAIRASSSRKQVLDKLGVTAATSNYRRLDEAASKLGLELPELRKHNHLPKEPSGAMADGDRLMELVSKGMDLHEILEEIGLKSVAANRHRLAGKLSQMGLVAQAKPVHQGRSPMENISRLTGSSEDDLGLAASHTNAGGDAAELAVASCLRRLGIMVSLPTGYACRYDMIADVKGKLFRVQVKSVSVRNGCLAVPISTYKMGTARRYEIADVDVIAVYSPDLGSVYWIPNSEIECSSDFLLRLNEPKNAQRAGIRSAFDYYIGQV